MAFSVIEGMAGGN